MKLDLEYKDEKINSLNKEIEELSSGGANEEEVTILKRQKADLENRLKDQEEELDDLAGQVQLLEAAKTKLEMSMAATKKVKEVFYDLLSFLSREIDYQNKIRFPVTVFPRL